MLQPLVAPDSAVKKERSSVAQSIDIAKPDQNQE